MGYAFPNLMRGRGSRTNFLAMVLQGFVRPAIDGSCPAYHIDKPAPGSGAGYLTNVLSYILDGRLPRVITPSRNPEEFAKQLVSELREGPQITFLDNINHEMNSPELAAALTAGTWRGRVLGSSVMVNMPMNCILVMTGNNLSYTTELMRRNIPINIDSKTPDPAKDRKKKDFKYELEPFLKKNRAKLVRSFLVLVKNWTRAGCPRGDHLMNSFEGWASTMGGIFDAADRITNSCFALSDSFLSNRDDYLGKKEHVKGLDLVFINTLFERCGTDRIAVDEIFRLLDEPDADFDIDAGFPGVNGRGAKLGRALTMYLRQTFVIGSERVLLQKGRFAKNGRTCYQFKVVKDQKDD